MRDNPPNAGFPAPAPWWAGPAKASSPDLSFLFLFFIFEKDQNFKASDF
jgi:hypothetical protein